MIRFKGKGEHSVNELEQIIMEREEELHQKQLKQQVLSGALVRISEWKLPSTGRFWDDEQKDPMSYEAAFGSNGARDFIMGVASKALKQVLSKIAEVPYIYDAPDEEWDDTDVNSVAEVSPCTIEWVEKGKEDFWSVYVHLVDGRSMCVADFSTEEQAVALAKLIDKLSKTRKL